MVWWHYRMFATSVIATTTAATATATTTTTTTAAATTATTLAIIGIGKGSNGCVFYRGIVASLSYVLQVSPESISILPTK